MNYSVRIDRQMISIPDWILDRFEEENFITNSEAKLISERLTYVDILYVLLEKRVSSSECRKIIKKIPDGLTLTKIVGLLIKSKRHSLMNEVIKDHNIEYDRRFVMTAIENDAFDIVFQLRNKYPQRYTKDEEYFIDSIHKSFSHSNHGWLAKCFLFKSVIELVSYRKAEEFLNKVEIKISSNDPKDSPLYFAPNMVLL